MRKAVNRGNAIFIIEAPILDSQTLTASPALIYGIVNMVEPRKELLATKGTRWNPDPREDPKSRSQIWDPSY